MAKQFWEDDAPASSAATPSSDNFWEGDKPAAAQALPKGVKPSTEGGGRGSVNPPIPAPALSDEELAKPAGAMARTIERGTAPDRRSLLERSVDGGTGIRAALESQERRSEWERQQIDGRAPTIRAAKRQRNDVDEDAGKDFALSGVGSNIVGRAGGKLVAGIAEGLGGTAQAIGDVTGIDTLARAGKATAEGAQAFQRGMGKQDAPEGFGPRSPVPYLQEQAEGAASSLGQSAALAAGVGAKAVIPVQAILQSGQSYSEARQAGMDPATALARAIPQGAFEAVGEKFQGLDKAAGAMGTLLNAGAGAAAKRTAADVLVRAGIREIPGEVLTYLGQTGTDLIPGIGLNPNMTMEQFIDGLKDTVVQSGMMGAATAGAGRASGGQVNRAAQPTAEQLARSKGFLAGGGTPTPAAPLAAAVGPDSAVPAAVSPVQPGAAPAELTNPPAVAPVSSVPVEPVVVAPPPGAFSRAAAAVGVLEDDGVATAGRDPKARPKTFTEQRDLQREVARQEEESDGQADFEAAMLSDQLAATDPTTTKATDEAPKETKAPAAAPDDAPAPAPTPAPAPAARSKAVVVDVPAPAPAIAGEDGRPTGERNAVDPDAAPAGQSDAAAGPGGQGSPSAASVSSEESGRNPGAPAKTSPPVAVDAPAARPRAPAAASAAAAKSPAARPADLAPRAPARASGSTEEGRATYKSVEEATAFISAQRARGTSISAVPVVNDDGEIVVAMKGSPEYERGLDQRQERIVKQAREDAGILDDDVVHTNGLAFKNAVAARAAAKKAGPEFAPVAVKGGFVARKSAEGKTDAPVPSGSDAGTVRGVAAEAAGGGRDNAPRGVATELGGAGASRGTAVPAAPVAAGKQSPVLPSSNRPDAALSAGASKPTAIAQAAHEAATSPTNDLAEPTQAQIEAGNYRKGHIKVQGLDISVENPQGSTRSGVGPPPGTFDKDGKPYPGKSWSHTMSDHYGYIKRTEGADGEQVDVYVGPKPESNRVFVVDQLDQKTGAFDEHKVMLGYPSQPLAMRAYKSNFDAGWKVGKVTAMTVDEFKAWLKDGDTAAPAAPATPEIAKLRNSAISAQSSEKSVAAESETQNATTATEKAQSATNEGGNATPKPKRELKADRLKREADEERAKYFAPGNVIRGYGNQFDRVISYQPADADGHWSVTVQRVKKTGPQTFEAVAGEQPRTHNTQPSANAIRTGPALFKPKSDEVQLSVSDGLQYPLAEPGSRYEETGDKPVTMMTPDEFLQRVKPLTMDEESRDAIDALKEHIESGRKLDPLHIRADGKEDGRHRAHAAKELGIKQVPVVDEQRVSFSAADPTETPAFKKWFKGSKVVDADGKPLVVYHGTASDFTKFDPKRIGDNFGADDRGFFFTSSPKEASDYAENDTVGVNKREGANVMPAYVALKNPLIITPEFLKDEGMGGLLGKNGSEDTITFWDTYQSVIHEWADERRSDGVIVVDPSFTESNGEPRRLVVAFKPNQIKSATGNRGTFDSRNADINLRTGEGAGPAVQTKPASTEHDRKAARLLNSLRDSQESYISFQAVEPDESGPEGRVFAALRTVAKRMFGHDVVFVRFNGPAVFNGAMSASIPDTVFVRIDSSKPHMAILGHELLHALRQKNPGLYNALEHRLNQLTNEKTGAFYDDLKRKYDAIGRKAPEGSKLREELYADIVGDNFLSPEFWQGMAADQPGLFRRVADAILRFLDKVILSLANSSPLGTQDLLRDAQEARRVVTAGMRAFSQQARARTGLATSSGESLSAAGGDGVKALVARLEAEHPGLKLDMAGSGNTLTLSRIVAPARGTGTGTKVMKAITDFADAEGKRIVLTPSGDFGGNKARLVEFYKRHGFIENKGRARDFTTKETMLREPVAAPAVEPAPPTGTLAFQRWFGKSKIVDENGKPRVAYRAMTGTTMQQNESIGMMHVALDRRMAEEFARDGRQVQEVYVSAKNPFDYRDKAARAWIVKEMTKPENVTLFNEQTKAMMGEGYDHEADAREIQGGLEAGAFQTYEVPMVAKMIRERGHDAIYMHEESDPRLNLAVFEPGQVKSATDNQGTFDAADPDIRLSAADAPAPAAPKKANPGLTKAIFAGSMQFTRDQSGKPVRLEEQKKLYEKIDTDERGQMLLRLGHVTADQLKRWKASPLDVYDGAVNNRFRKHFESPGIVWKDAELRSIFKLDDDGIAAYRALRAQADESIARHAVADMLRLAGPDGLAVRDQVLGEPMDVAAITLRDHLLSLADQKRTPAPAPKVTMTEAERAAAMDRAVSLEAEAAALSERSPDKPPANALAKIDEAKKLRADVAASIQAPASMTVEARRLTDRANMVIDILDQANDDMGGGKVPDDMKAQARPNPWESTAPTRTDRAIYEMQDGKVDLKRTQEAIERSGAKIREEFDARLAETLYSGRMAKRTQTFLEKEAKPLLQQMAMNRIGQEELGDYLHARAAKERNEQIAKVNPDMPDGGAGANSKGLLLTTAAAKKYMDDIPAEHRAKLEALAQRVDAITKNTRALLVAEGLEKADTIAAWEAVYKTYVPMFREDVEFSRITVSKRAMGSEKRAVNILANVLLQREAAITRAEKNRVNVSLYGLALTNPNPDFWVTIRPETDRAEIAEDLKRMGIDPLVAEAGMGGVPTVSTVDPVTNLVTEQLNPFYRQLPGAITMKINGEHRVLLLNMEDPRAERMANAMKGVDGLTQLDIAGSVVGKATRWLAAVNTQYNPVFGLVNFLRDSMGGVIHLGNTELRGSATKVMASVPGALAGITAHLAGRADKGKWSKLFEQFQEDGGQTGFREMFADGTKRAEKVEKDLSVMSRHALDPRRAVNGLLDLLGGFNEVTENAVRLSAYAAALDKGMSRPEAARLARELTVDFNRKGRATRELGPLYAFFNAAIQGNERTLRALRGPTGGRILAGGFALGVMQALMLAAAGFDDDEVPDYIKARSLIIPLFNKEKSYIAIPLPLGLHVIPNTGRVVTEMVIGDRKKLGKKAIDSIGEILAAFNPLGGGNVFTMDGALRTIAPTVVDPLIEIGFNKNFAGNQIEREARGQYDARPGAERARASTQKTFTGQTYIGISKAINRMTGGDDFQPGMISPTPERVRYLTQTMLGGVARETERIIDASVAKSSGKELPWSRTPVASRFYGQVENDRVQQSRYYENIKSLEQTEGQMKAAKKAGDGERMAEIAAANPIAAFIGASNKVQQSVQKLNKLSVQVIGNREEQDAIDKKKIEAMQALNDGIRFMEQSRRQPTIAERMSRMPATQEE